MGNRWVEHVKKFKKKHPDMPDDKVYHEARKTYKTNAELAAAKKKRSNKKGKGLDPVSGTIEAAAKAIDSLGNAATSFGNAVDQGRLTTQQIREQQGKNDYTRAKYSNKTSAEQMMSFERYLDTLNDARYHNPGLLPPSLKFQAFDLPGNLTNKLPRFRERKMKANNALYKYAY